MIETITAIWRHRVQSQDRMAPDSDTLTAGQTMPGDRFFGSS